MNYREDDDKFKVWARQIKIQDNWTCQICGAKGGYMEAHHLNGYNSFPEQRYNLDNGKNLCQRCHQRFHDAYGYGGNTAFQYKEYEEIANTLKKIAEKIALENKTPPENSENRN